jgi:quercetin dioxygenase-like cupin family protein
MTDITTKGLIVVPAGDGEPRWIGSSRITVKATAAQTNGGYGLIVSEVARGISAPLHIHHTAEEGIWVISGRILVRCGTDEFTLGPGGYTSLPRGVPHTFLAEQDTTMLGLITRAAPRATSPRAARSPPPRHRRRPISNGSSRRRRSTSANWSDRR